MAVLSVPPIVRPERLFSILTCALMAIVLSTLSQGIVVAALPLLGHDLGNGERLPWVITAYLVASTVTIPTFGKLSDIHGRRAVLLCALAIFVLGSASCAIARSMTWLIMARALQGAGGGALTSIALTIIGDVIAPRERARFQPALMVFSLAGTLGGPVLGGFVAERYQWPMIFWINVPLGLLTAWLSSSALRRLPRYETRHRLDVEGALLMTGATVALLVAITGKLSRPAEISMVLASAATWAAFGFWLKRTPTPLIPLHILADPIVRNGTMAATLGIGGFLALTVYVPLYLQYVFRLSPSQSGIALVPPILGSAVGSILAGQIMPHYSRYRRVAVVGLIAAIGNFIVLGLSARVGASLKSFEILLVSAALGVGALLPVTTISIQNTVPLADLGAATATNSYVRQLGASVLVALYGVVLTRAGIGAGINSVNAPDPRLSGAFAWLCVCSAAAAMGALLFLLRMDERPLRSNKI